MLLALDIGNSRIKWGLRDAADWVSSGYFPTRDFLPAGAQDYEFELPVPADRGGLVEGPEHPVAGVPPPPAALLGQVTDIAVCSVSGSSTERRLLEHLHAQGLPHWPLLRVVSGAAALGVRNGYAEPGRLGTDRWAALIAARARSPAPTVVVMAGTATVVDALGPDGAFLGGYILPGLRLMPKSLYERTAGIRPDDGAWSQFPTRTADAVASGVLAATAGAVAGMVQSLRRQCPGQSVATLVSGGNGPILMGRLRELELAPTYARDLVLEGVERLFDAGLLVGS